MQWNRFISVGMMLYLVLVFVAIWNMQKFGLIVPKGDSIGNVTFQPIHQQCTHTETHFNQNEGQLPKYFGLGDDGGKIIIPDNNTSYESVRKQYLSHGVNNFISDMIGIKRILPDRRPQKCLEIQYSPDLPEVSVVIIFRDEPATSLLRTLYSALENSPSSLLKEVILVDDGTTNKYIKTAVALHVANVKKTKLLTNEKSLGLMLARQRGIETAQSKYVIVLDGHMEVTPGWLEPILDRLVQVPNALLTSHVLWIDKEDFKLKTSYSFDFTFLSFYHLTLKEEYLRYTRKARNNSVAPIEYGMIPGNMMAIRKAYFLQLGGFDPGMKVWGAEHLELSVKVWLCGGRVEMVPCSVIGHLYRLIVGRNFEFLNRNKIRFVSVWMDGFLQTLALEVLHKGNVSKWQDPGDITDRLKIKTKNRCKPYQYFIDQLQRLASVYIPKNLHAMGIIRNSVTGTCLKAPKNGKDGAPQNVLIHAKCTGNDDQFFILTEKFSIRVKNSWVAADLHTFKIKLYNGPQSMYGLIFKWSYDTRGVIKHVSTERCLTAGIKGKISLEKCSDTANQIWQWPFKSDVEKH